MEIGVHVPQVGPLATREAIMTFARAAEAAGFDGLWVFDHVVLSRRPTDRYPYSADGRLGFSPRHNFLEALTELTFIAGITERIRLGTSVLVLPMRQPVLAAKVMASLDFLSRGRFILGAGVGWWPEEFEVLSVPFAGRGQRMDECLQLLRACWRDEWVDFDGALFRVDGWTCNPKPDPGIPIWLGGESRQQMERVGRYADGWLATSKSRPTLRQDFERARAAAVRAGRDPAVLRLSMECGLTLRRDNMPEVAERFAALAAEGVSHAIAVVDPTVRDQTPILAAFGAAHLPGLHAL